MSTSTGSPILAWHLVGALLRDGRPIPPDGVWLRHDGEIVMCPRPRDLARGAGGLHASRRLIDALNYAPGSTICRVAVDQIGDEDRDKLVARSRVILWRLEAADDLLRAFARRVALSVIHLWDAPPVVRQYLETGDENLGAAAWDAARAAAWDAAGDAAWDAARAAARAVAWDAARVAAWDAARAAARAVAWAAGDAAFEKFNVDLEAMVREAAGNPDDDALLAKLGEPA